MDSLPLHRRTLAAHDHPAALIGEIGAWSVMLRAEQVTLGALVLINRRDALAFSALPPEDFASFGEAVRRVERMLAGTVGYEKMNYLMLMMIDPNVHMHALPRYAGTKTFAGQDFPDAAWPSPPDLARFTRPQPAVRDALVAALRAAWS
jgi:diadenosine tetraphosphate (Ap4A) HIT family hydrolase